MSEGTVQLEDPEESDSADDLDLPEELDCQSGLSVDEEVEEVTPCTGEIESVADDIIPSSRSVSEVKEPAGTTAEKEDEAKQDLTEDRMTPLEVRLEELELDVGSERTNQAHAEALDAEEPTEDIAAPSLQERLVETKTETDALSDRTEPSETVPDVTDEAGEREFDIACQPLAPKDSLAYLLHIAS
jgi:hypothetical protein